jgi:hypothetical protein
VYAYLALTAGPESVLYRNRGEGTRIRVEEGAGDRKDQSPVLEAVPHILLSGRA